MVFVLAEKLCTISRILEGAQECAQVCYMLCVDLQTVFGHIPSRFLWGVLREYSVLDSVV